MDEDFDVDDILKDLDKKKKKNSGKKGKAGERLLIDELSIRFPGKPFSRTLGSGNRWSQARLTETAKQVFTGDIICPDEFLFALECKKGYNDIDLDRAVKRWLGGKSGNKQLDTFLEQAEKDGERVGKKPLLCWKKDYKPWHAFLKTEDLTKNLKKFVKTTYKGWAVFLLEDVLKEPDAFFLKG